MKHKITFFPEPAKSHFKKWRQFDVREKSE